MVFNVTNNECRKVADSGGYKFYSVGNQAALVGNEVIALVDNFENNYLIKWTLGHDRVSIIQIYAK